MKIFKVIFFTYIIVFTTNAAAIESDELLNNPSKDTNKLFSQIMPEIFYSYFDLNYNSRAGNNFSHFGGHANKYGFAVNTLMLSTNTLAGIYLYKVDTKINSTSLLNPFPLTRTYQDTKNNSVLLHIARSYTNWLVVDLAGGYGNNRLNIISNILSETPNSQTGFAHVNNNNWFTSASVLFYKEINKFYITGNVGTLYSRYNAPSYTLYYPTISTRIPQNINTVLWIFENANLYYPITDYVSPFISGGLLQVAKYSDSNPFNVTLVNGSLPQLTLDKNAYRLACGVQFTHRSLGMRLGYEYYNAGSIFITKQLKAQLSFNFA
ncbi:hypothetical protein [Legionella tunisiensis]|uniref:hypothetical protein n=1 Tax=Legionella tunisiensis TaxID=1034944 RepID=UPI0002DFF4E8|nr:hypothetical protein [Legionella tunisiensis]